MTYVLQLAAHTDLPVQTVLRVLLRQPANEAAQKKVAEAVKLIGLPDYRHLFDEALGLSGPEISLLTVLMLRGAQTVGELKSRAERLHRFASLAEVDETLHALAGRELVARLERRPGQKEERWEHRLGETAPREPSEASLEERVRALEEQVAELREQLDPR